MRDISIKKTLKSLDKKYLKKFVYIKDLKKYLSYEESFAFTLSLDNISVFSVHKERIFSKIKASVFPGLSERSLSAIENEIFSYNRYYKLRNFIAENLFIDYVEFISIANSIYIPHVFVLRIKKVAVSFWLNEIHKHELDAINSRNIVYSMNIHANLKLLENDSIHDRVYIN
ncbi:MAG: hypothetical protein QXP88_00670 [Thermoproteota archaeon]